MEESEIKTSLEKLTKQGIVDAFPSLEMKKADTKASLIEEVLTGEPTEEEKAAFKKMFDSLEAAPKYIVVHRIKEDGSVWEIGKPYLGEKPERIAHFLKGGQIKEN